MQEDNEKHMAICEKCRQEYFDTTYHSWLCVPCDKVGYGVEDNSVIT
jgi:hypothetical protein